jgi:hypothetical protein
MSSTTEERRTSSTPAKPASATAWRKRNDAGPHRAVFPSGVTLKFVIPDQGTLLRAGRLPDALREVALLCAAHPDGAEGYMQDLVMQAIVTQGERSDIVTKAIESGLELGHELVAEMLVEPKVTAEEVRRGDFPELDVRMLLEFAERRRNLDAAGNQLPITVLSEWARFRDGTAGLNGSGDSGTGGLDDRADVSDAHGGEV